MQSPKLQPFSWSRRAMLALALPLLAATVNPMAAQAADTIDKAKIGAVYALSGTFAIYSPTVRNGIEMATDDLNAQGGLQLEVLLEDDRSTKDDAITVYQKFIRRDEALLIMGPITGGQVFAAAPLAQRAKVPVMLTSVATPGVTKVGDYVFRTSVESTVIIPNTVKVAKEQLKLQKVAQVYTNDDQFAVGEFKAYETALKENGIEIATVETVRTGDVDFSPQLTKIKSLGVDGIVISTQGQEAVGLITQARKLGLDKVAFLGGNAFNSSGVVKEAGAAMEGALSATPWSIGMTHPKNVEFVKRYRERFKSDPDWLAAQTYDALFIIKHALLSADIAKSDKLAVARTKLRDALAATKSFDGVLGKIEFTADRDPVVEGAVIRVENGKHVIATK
jgi:branched-chain amino acid transport system substrate-binding protein